jgi:flagellar hook-associated protein FlgK
MAVLRDAVERSIRRLRVLLDDPDELRRLEKLYNAFKKKSKEARREAAKEILLAELKELFGSSKNTPPQRGCSRRAPP